MEFSALQPTIQWLHTPQSTHDCPPGLEYLSQINQLLVCQRFDLWKDLSHFEHNKIYEVMNNQRQRIYFAEEKCNCFLRHLCGSSRPFTMTIYDTIGRDVITIHKALSCGCWNNCFLQKLKIEAPPGETIGYVYQCFHPFWPKFKIKNEKKEDVMEIRGPCVISSCLKDLNFNLLSIDEERVIGNISSSDKFGIQFPFDLDVKIKALMLGASFLIQSLLADAFPP
ncbi:PREDICTED: phospholipid scramblase 1-like [Condylura cristata]|uniref:phospholipid scramblase 1-like n=1 Tax=Condylura cristata TaxID=143302 RepID=UPI000643CA2E|nr:PREDICTED: phospholipid scramblase 1-like [Condylura cristata]